MAESLIHGGAIITKVDDSGEAVTISDGAVFQRDGVIVEVGAYTDLLARYRPEEVIGSADHVVLPGFVNAHHHIGITPFQLGSPEHPLELWFASRIGDRDVDPYLDTLYSAFEMLESGVTSVHHIGRRGPTGNGTTAAEQALQAYRDIGMRVTFSFGFRDQNRLVYKDDKEFVATLPQSLAPQVSEMLDAQAFSFDEYLSELFLPLWESTGKNTEERVRIALSPSGFQWCSDDAFVALREAADQYGVGLHMHFLETIYQRVYAETRSGTTALRHLDAIGFLGPDVTLGHGVWTTEDELDLAAEVGAKVCHNASSNLRLRSGLAPLNDMLSRGITVAMGIDEAGINDDRDMLQEMRLVSSLHGEPGLEGRAPTAAQILKMATQDGAHTTGFAHETGTLEPGMGADMLVIRWDQLAYPYLDAAAPVVEAIIRRLRPGGIDAVLVAGEVVARNGRSTRVDKTAVLEELARSLAVPLTTAERRRKEIAHTILPHVRGVLDGWLDRDTAAPYRELAKRRS